MQIFVLSVWTRTIEMYGKIVKCPIPYRYVDG